MFDDYCRSFSVARLRAVRRAGNPGKTAESGFDVIVAKQAGPLREAEPAARFSPIAVIALGVRDARSIRAISDMSRALSSPSGGETGRVRREFMTALSLERYAAAITIASSLADTLNAHVANFALFERTRKSRNRF